jgi:hypothetical protein
MSRGFKLRDIYSLQFNPISSEIHYEEVVEGIVQLEGTSIGRFLLCDSTVFFAPAWLAGRTAAV